MRRGLQRKFSIRFRAVPSMPWCRALAPAYTGRPVLELAAGNPCIRAVLARPVEITEALDQERCSFSSQIPGVVDGVSKIFYPETFGDLITLEVRLEDAIRTARS